VGGGLVEEDLRAEMIQKMAHLSLITYIFRPTRDVKGVRLSPTFHSTVVIGEPPVLGVAFVVLFSGGCWFGLVDRRYIKKFESITRARIDVNLPFHPSFCPIFL